MKMVWPELLDMYKTNKMGSMLLYIYNNNWVNVNKWEFIEFFNFFESNWNSFKVEFWAYCFIEAPKIISSKSMIFY